MRGHRRREEGGGRREEGGGRREEGGGRREEGGGSGCWQLGLILCVRGDATCHFFRRDLKTDLHFGFSVRGCYQISKAVPEAVKTFLRGVLKKYIKTVKW
jgi:hypothetical protein